MTLSAVAIFGCLGLAVDLGRMYIAKNEAQGYADSAALAAALKLDGTSTGITAAQTAATSMADKWNFMTSSFSGTVVEVSTAATGPWTSAGSPPTPAPNYTYVRVTTQAPVTLYFMPLVGAFLTSGTPATSSTVKAVAVAAQLLQTTFNEGAFPFSPIGFDGPTGTGATTSPWGFVAGQQYTIRYESSGKSECTGDTADSNHIKIGSARGFWGNSSAAVITEQVQGDLQEESLTVGEVLPGVGGAKTSVAAAIDSRVSQDSNTTDTTYADYLKNGGNGRRVVTMPIQSEVNGTVLGFGTFMLLASGSYDHTGHSNWCAVFVGEAKVDDTSNPGAGGTAAAYQVKLVQ